MTAVDQAKYFDVVLYYILYTALVFFTNNRFPVLCNDCV